MTLQLCSIGSVNVKYALIYNRSLAAGAVWVKGRVQLQWTHWKRPFICAFRSAYVMFFQITTSWFKMRRWFTNGTKKAFMLFKHKWKANCACLTTGMNAVWDSECHQYNSDSKDINLHFHQHSANTQSQSTFLFHLRIQIQTSQFPFNKCTNSAFVRFFLFTKTDYSAVITTCQ